jgi:putative ABC transport system substrate-binding protein
MRRREFVGLVGGAAAWPLAAGAQQQRALPVIGWLHAQGANAHRAFMPAFHRGLSDSGYVEGRNVAIEHGYADGHPDRRPALIADFVRRQVAVMVTDTTVFARVAKAATQVIPIVFASAGGYPVEFGLVASLNRPGGNVTGVALLGLDIIAKRLELVHKLVPMAPSIAMLAVAAGSQFAEAETRDLQSAAQTLGVRVTVINAETEREIAAGFATLVEQKAGALLIGAGIQFQERREQIITLAARHAIPTLFWESASVAAGALASYGPDFMGAYHQAGLYVGRILKGEKPADLPVVQPTKFELVINLKTAKALGLDIPATVLALADEVIE